MAVPALPKKANKGYTAEPTLLGTPRFSFPCLTKTPIERYSSPVKKAMRAGAVTA